MGTNQGESSNEWKGTKTPYQMASVENREGNESGVSSTAGLGAVVKDYSSPTGNDGINGEASAENQAAKFKYPSVSQDQGAGANQYE